MQAWVGMWSYPDFRRAHYAITALWAAANLLEAVGQALMVHPAGFNAAYTWTQILPLTATAAAILLTIAIARHHSHA